MPEPVPDAGSGIGKDLRNPGSGVAIVARRLRRSARAVTAGRSVLLLAADGTADARCRAAFRRGIKGRESLTDAEWAEFTAQTLTPNFPEGFTVFDGEGQWRNPQTGHIAGGRTKILLVAAKQESDLARRLTAVIDAYKAKFHQQSVGLITRDSCAGF